MGYTINIVDLDNVLHIGTKAGRMGEFNVSSFPTGGIYQVFRMINQMEVLKYPESNKVIFVYDKHTNYRKQLYPEYKGKRKDYKTNVDLIKDKAVRLQKTYLVEELTKAGFMVIGKDYLEADDAMFNIALSLAYRQEQPLANGLSIVIHSSDEDWLGILGLGPNIYFKCTNANSSTLSSVRTYGNYLSVYGTRPELHYMYKAVYGDKSDNYRGFMNPSIFDTNEALTCNNTQYWNYFYWEEIFKKNYANSGEILNNMLLNLRLAFPIYDNEIYERDYLSELWTNPINTSHIVQMLELLRIKILQKELGKLKEFSQQNINSLNALKQNFMNEYSDVFEYYSKREYEPVISTTEVKSTFDKFSKKSQ